MLFEKLRDEGKTITGVARNRRGLSDTGNATLTECDANDTDRLLDICDGSTVLIHCSRPEILTSLLTRKPNIDRLIALGSTRVYTRFPDDKCARLAAMSHVIRMGDIPATILHPTMIYGAPGLNNIERILKIARLSPWIPLPENGKALIQPVHADDVLTALLICLNDESTTDKTIVLAGKSPVSYREFIELCIEIEGTRCRVISFPYLLLTLLGLLTQIVPRIPAIGLDELRRLLEDKNFSTTDAEELLGRAPQDLASGLRATIIEGAS
jgi:nucleoside-diphosphate-sugar epimerase